MTCKVTQEELQAAAFATLRAHPISEQAKALVSTLAGKLLASGAGREGERGGTSRSADLDPLAGLGDLPLVLELKLQLFNYLGQPLSCKGVCGLQGEPVGLLQLSFQYHAPHACHLGSPIYPEFSKMCTERLTIR
jgi:hypothetical protein